MFFVFLYHYYCCTVDRANAYAYVCVTFVVVGARKSNYEGFAGAVAVRVFVLAVMFLPSSSRPRRDMLHIPTFV